MGLGAVHMNPYLRVLDTMETVNLFLWFLCISSETRAQKRGERFSNFVLEFSDFDVTKRTTFIDQEQGILNAWRKFMKNTYLFLDHLHVKNLLPDFGTERSRNSSCMKLMV